MGIIKRADLETYTRDAVPMDLGDLQKRGEAVIAAAQEEAARILKEATEERERLVSDASETGHEEGYKAGFAKGQEAGTIEGTQQAEIEHTQRLESLASNWSSALEQWDTDRIDLMINARNEVIELAAHIASRVIKRTIDLDPEVVVDQLEVVLETLVTPTDIRIKTHPSDTELLKRVMPAMIQQCSACNHAELAEDDALTPGSCVVTTKGGGTIDASISTQLNRIVATLLPAHRGPDYDRHLDEDEGADTTDSTTSESKDDAA
ncbi:MAG: hypothetical protein JJ974_02520 [Phycisphaerales bacterium]|nr:hypothetical protein [Phycisphaerales bacterium]